MRRLQVAAATAAAAMILSACSGAVPGSSSAPAAGGPAATGPAVTPPPGGGPGTITGSFTLQAQKHSEDPTIQGVIDDALNATIMVKMKRDSSAPNEAYVDDGSTYKVSAETKTSRQLGDCTATSDTVGEGTFKFSDQPFSTPNDITATVDRAGKAALFFVSFSWGTHVQANACDGRAPFDGENGAAVACPLFGLAAKLTEGNGTDQIDMACQLPGGETYAGLLTLTR